MAQFGAGPEFSAQCPRVSVPDGWRSWQDADGPIPEPLGKRAQALIDDTAVPLGTTESYPLPGVTTLIRVEPRVWGRDAQGALMQGCFRAGGIYLPAESSEAGLVAPVSESKLAKVIGALTIVSLAVGTAATLATWGRS